MAVAHASIEEPGVRVRRAVTLAPAFALAAVLSRSRGRVYVWTDKVKGQSHRGERGRLGFRAYSRAMDLIGLRRRSASKSGREAGSRS